MKRLTGFTIIECVIALAITTLTILLAGWGLTALSTSNRHSLDSSVDWYIFLQEMEADSHHFILRKVAGTELQVYSPRTGFVYTLQGRDVLYLKAWGRGGYLPLLEGIQGKTCRFKQLVGQRVRVEVVRENGEKLVGIIQFYHA
ncbi:MAG: competence type IV pilus minor pilin ComGF [Limosilactobacillus pontis]|uniref:Prepilin-type N-terminal cleavage/methylation domain-containing protein n=1 Tax=Limosilactobacillus pontis TaxID=35787 RepID=A0A2J6NLX5_9LACO|nr:ComGF family competence protein [Limosilactobacillus pontis]PMB82206.1 hypothetical protein CK797_07330 [Limosilactobacillus pontis]